MRFTGIMIPASIGLVRGPSKGSPVQAHGNEPKVILCNAFAAIARSMTTNPPKNPQSRRFSRNQFP
jgi:hypothetical protein